MSKKTKAPKIEADQPANAAVDWAAIAELEKKMHKEDKPMVVESKSVSFDDWWLAREAELNKPLFYKEILKADFSGRGLSKKETMDRWDWAAKQFGLKW
jgi:hypothetical protein